MTKCLVTGGAGFIGSNLVDRLLELGNEVRVLDDLSTGKKDNLRLSDPKLELIHASVTDQEAVRRSMAGVDYVFHLAAVRAVLRSVDDPLTTNEVNITGTLNLLLAAQKACVRRFVFSSSCSVYGDTSILPTHEDVIPNPESPYAASKVMGEYYCKLFSRLYGLETVCLRYFNVFGPRQNPESKYSSVIPILIDCLTKGESPEIHWDGLQSRDFVCVDSVVDSNILAIQKPGISGEVFNIGTEKDYSILDIFNMLKRILKQEGIRPVFKPKRPGDVRRAVADTSKAKRMMGFQVEKSFEEDLKKTVEWFLCNVTRR